MDEHADPGVFAGLGRSPVVIVAGSIEVAPEDREAYLADRAPIVVETRAEPGCLDYAFSADGLDPGRVRVFERWASASDLERHLGIVADRAKSAPPPVPILRRELVRYLAEEARPRSVGT